LIECGDAQECGRFFASLLRLDLRNLFFCGSEADAELLHITEPSLTFGFSDPVVEVVSDLFESKLFSGADDEDRAPDAGVFMDAIRSVCPSAISERELPTLEMAEKFFPFFWGEIGRCSPSTVHW
jgi:hypothetical protein